MSILNGNMQITIRCLNKNCGKTFLFDSDAWPPRRYCSEKCSNAVRMRRWRSQKKIKEGDGTSTPSDDPSGTPGAS